METTTTAAPPTTVVPAANTVTAAAAVPLSVQSTVMLGQVAQSRQLDVKAIHAAVPWEVIIPWSKIP